MSGARSRQRGRGPRGPWVPALCLAIGAAWVLTPAVWAAPGAPAGLYQGGYAQGRALAPTFRPTLASASVSKRVSPARSIGASLLVPGWGQRLAGRAGRARAFLATEAVLIGVFIGLRIQGEVRQERYIDYAELFAGVREASGKSDGYYRNLGRYASTADYEDDLMRDARARYGDDIEQREAYVASRRPPADEAWLWESTAHREAFTEMRRGSRSSFHRADQMIGIILLNHLLSAVDAARLSRRGGSGKALYLSAGPDGTNYVGLSWPLDE